jgi:predicted nucleic-acid-binding protein
MPKYPLIDANVFLRHITQDDKAMAQKAQAFFKDLESNKITATTCEAIILEVVYVLSSKQLYNMARADVARHLSNLLGLPGIRLQYKQMYIDALSIYSGANVDIADIILSMHAKRNGSNTVMSFDQDFDHIAGITRQEP